MNGKIGFEKFLTFMFALLFLGAVITVVVLDPPHGGFGDSYAPEEINSRVILDQGHIQDPAIPDELLVLGAGQEATVKFEVFNVDPDNDIDTIEIEIPGSEMLYGSSEWYKSGSDHEWPYQITETDVISFEAYDDFTGSEGGDVAYYDTAGNVDDALDYIEDFNDGDNPVYNLSEGITLAVTFNASETPGLKMGEDAINLRVGDLKTEDPGVPLTTFDPFPYPYIVGGTGDIYLIILLKTSSCHLEVQYGEEHLFSYSRGTDIRTSDHGFEYVTDSGSTVAVLEDPEETVVNPLVIAKEDGLTGEFTLDMYKIEITDIEVGYVDEIPIVTNYKDEIPSEMGQIVDNDLDKDGILNNVDDDMDGDGIPNSVDNFPKIYNLMPVVTGKTENLTVKEDEVFSLTVEANDPEMEDLTYTWTNDQDSEWNASGWKIDLTGFEPGTYIFTVTISDEMGNSRTESIKVTIEDNLSPVINEVSADKTEITVGDELVLSVNASDPEGKTLICTWTNNIDAEWKEIGNTVIVKDLKEGEYTFTVTVSDGWSNSTGTVDVTVKEEEGGLMWVIIIIIIVVVVLIILAIVVFMILKKKKGETTDEGMAEGSVETGYVQEEASPESYYEGFYDPNAEQPDAEGYSPDAPMEFYPDDAVPPPQADSYEGSSVMEYPQEATQESIPDPEKESGNFPEAPPVELLSSAPPQEPQPMPISEEGASEPDANAPPSMPSPPPPVPEFPAKPEEEVQGQ